MLFDHGLFSVPVVAFTLEQTLWIQNQPCGKRASFPIILNREMDNFCYQCYQLIISMNIHITN